MFEELTLLPCPACKRHSAGIARANSTSVAFVICKYVGCALSGPIRKTDEAAVATWNAMPRHSTPRPIDEWHEDYGDVLWWRFPLEGPPYVGSPLDEDWVDDGYFTHWTPLPTPQSPE